MTHAADTAEEPRRSLFAPHQAPRLAVQIWLLSRLMLLIVALVSMWTRHRTLTEVFNSWDVVHFVAISQEGYTTLTQAAFFPGLPLLLAGFSLLGIPPLLTGVIISLAGSALAAYGLYRLAGGSIGGTVAVGLWSFAPMTVFTFVGYTEAIFCAAAFWAFWFARRDRWRWAALLASAGCLIRVSGLFLVGALVLAALLWPPARTTTPPGAHAKDAPIPDTLTWADRRRRLVWMIAPLAALLGYIVFLRVRFGTWTAWFDAQSEGWGRNFHWPWEAIANTLSAAGVTAPPSETSSMFLAELIVAIIGILLASWCLATRRIPEAGWVGVQVAALSFQIWLVSLSRALLLWFPLFTITASRLGEAAPAGRNDIRRAVLGAGLACEAIMAIWWAGHFFAGHWSG